MAKPRPVTGIDPARRVRPNARKILATRIDEIYQYDGLVANPANITDLHNMRIAFKRLRYLLEIFEAAFGADLEPFLDQVSACYQDAYGQEPFVRLLDGKALPDTKNVVGTNVIEIAWRLDPRTGRLLVMSAEDNLVKGASGQAIQSMNLMCGFPEPCGLI